MNSLAELSSNLLYIAFFFYFAATVFYILSVTGRQFRNKEGNVKKNRWGTWGYIATVIGVVFAFGYFFTRWAAGGHPPVSNMFEYTAFLAICFSLAFVVINGIYKSNVLGLFTIPVIMLIIAYASVFSTEIAPLVPSLQSNWLAIHVITVALAQGILAVSFGAGLVYLVRTLDLSGKKMTKRTFGIEFIMYTLLTGLAFVILTNVFEATNYEAQFTYVNEQGEDAEKTYNLPAIIGPNEGVLQTEDRFSPIFYAPDWIISEDLNTVVWSFGSGFLLYWVIRLIGRNRRIAAMLQPLLKGVKPQTVDELSYRAIAIGFPLFALGGLAFAMIYAQIAWTRFWGWDPKEVWALITFFFYAAYLHLRLSRNWIGERSAWLAVIGFAIIMFNLIFVNLVIAGLHSYA
ncbi:c-type cytochrome biogenesis protein CcsB [Geomicrobium sp. JCM 19055]|uniref:c-type cytochrome biogenesis protein CcsB n=1 Tax=Geomicrobium sp. JCM 19055 TaxID=1460649 RepID=UPI00045ECDA6|nr:c-type cytochrome biogenesis protein CcsB [Geomicrobium sp. JCM 19055]GAJ98701.1 cytochrome c-type biogenesis protein CcsA/ResC [Geomicrobium sp. JCM 19055]